MGARGPTLDLIAFTAACSGDPETDSDEQALSGACAGGTESFEGIEGDYARDGVTFARRDANVVDPQPP